MKESIFAKRFNDARHAYLEAEERISSIRVRLEELLLEAEGRKQGAITRALESLADPDFYISAGPGTGGTAKAIAEGKGMGGQHLPFANELGAAIAERTSARETMRENLRQVPPQERSTLELLFRNPTS